MIDNKKEQFCFRCNGTCIELKFNFLEDEKGEVIGMSEEYVTCPACLGEGKNKKRAYCRRGKYIETR